MCLLYVYHSIQAIPFPFDDVGSTFLRKVGKYIYISQHGVMFKKTGSLSTLP